MWQQKKTAASQLIQAWNEEVAAMVNDGERKAFRTRVFLFIAACEKAEILEKQGRQEEAKFASGVSDEILYSMLKQLARVLKRKGENDA